MYSDLSNYLSIAGLIIIIAVIIISGLFALCKAMSIFIKAINDESEKKN